MCSFNWNALLKIAADLFWWMSNILKFETIPSNWLTESANQYGNNICYIKYVIYDLRNLLCNGIYLWFKNIKWNGKAHLIHIQQCISVMCYEKMTWEWIQAIKWKEVHFFLIYRISIDKIQPGDGIKPPMDINGLNGKLNMSFSQWQH